MKKQNLLRKLVLLNILVFMSCQTVEQKVLTLPPVFSDHMVLQQTSEVPVWGTITANQEVKVQGSWGSSATATSDNTGKWKVSLATPSYGGPFELNVTSGKQVISFSDVLIGEVWLSSGQSNMEWRMNQCDNCIDNQEEEIANANYNEIRMFTVPMDLTGEQIKETEWMVANPENVGISSRKHPGKGFSATAYFFARKLQKELKIPIGIVNTSWGGTMVEAWTSLGKLKTMDATKDIVKHDNMDDYIKAINFYKDSITLINRDIINKDIQPIKIIDNSHLDVSSGWWETLNLNDRNYIINALDDSSWSQPKVKTAAESLSFEELFSDNELAADGAIWFRTKVMVEDISKDYELIINDGVDDQDVTYFNGELIGSTMGWNVPRNYKVPKALLKKGENVIAIRVYDGGGSGGFISPVIFKNDSLNQVIPFNKFRYRHQAFVINGYLFPHNFSSEELIDESTKKITSKIIKIMDNGAANIPGRLFYEMLSPVMPYGIKGAIWYQGESNVFNAKDYNELFNGMIEDWRSHWGHDFPFYYVQIAPFRYNDPTLFSQELRDAQRTTLHTTPKTGMAIILDIGEEENIHPSNKQDVGDRLALLALDNDYGYDLVSSGPLYKSLEVFPTHIDVDFYNKGSGLMSKTTLTDFEIAGSDGVFQKASARILNNKVRVSSNKVSNPKEVRYGWKNWIVGTLFNKEGLPASSFSSIN